MTTASSPFSPLSSTTSRCVRSSTCSRRLELVDEITRHRFRQVVASDHQTAACGVPRHKHRGLAGRITAPDDDNWVAVAELSLGLGGRVVDPETLVALEVGQVELAVLGSGRDDHRPAVDDRAVPHLDREVVVDALESDRRRRDDEAGAQPPGLQLGPLGQFAPGDPRGETQIVLDPSGRARLSSERDRVDRLGVQPFGGPVQGSRKPGRATTHDHEIAHGRRRPSRAKTEHLAHPRVVTDCAGRRGR